MQRKPVKSSNIKSAGWQNGKLDIEFPGGAVHRYDCDEETYRKFLAAESKGGFFHKHLKKLPSKKVDASPA